MDASQLNKFELVPDARGGYPSHSLTNFFSRLEQNEFVDNSDQSGSYENIPATSPFRFPITGTGVPGESSFTPNDLPDDTVPSAEAMARINVPSVIRATKDAIKHYVQDLQQLGKHVNAVLCSLCTLKPNRTYTQIETVESRGTMHLEWWQVTFDFYSVICLTSSKSRVCAFMFRVCVSDGTCEKEGDVWKVDSSGL
ncbi:unnamed protein product [Rhizoctonia solani]|uniref:Uncharacterized protein n=1 Tax=Rhizoctonia solani TaxID=456999 RepID=A0A8H3DQX5_9AGAM|nr:unnamed protein product [Rhizoctonia solani]